MERGVPRWKTFLIWGIPTGLLFTTALIGLSFRFFNPLSAPPEDNTPSIDAVRAGSSSTYHLPAAASSSQEAIPVFSPDASFRKDFAGEKRVAPPDGTSKLDWTMPEALELSSLLLEVEAALSENAPESEKLAAIRKLEGIEDPAVLDVAVMALRDPEPEIRLAALNLVGDMDHEAVNAVLSTGLDDDNTAVSAKALDILSHTVSPALIPSLARALSNPDPSAQQTALETLEDIPVPGAVDVIIEKGLLSDIPEIRQKALDSMEYITGLRFEDHADARTWWDINRYSFPFEDEE